MSDPLRERAEKLIDNELAHLYAALGGECFERIARIKRELCALLASAQIEVHGACSCRGGSCGHVEEIRARWGLPGEPTSEES